MSRAAHIAAAMVATLVLAFAQAQASPSTPGVPGVRIPHASYVYRFKLRREVVSRFGDDTAVARVAGQLHAESRWRADARSKYAQGLGQITPATAQWLPTVCPEIGPADLWDSTWSIRATVCYDHYLFRNVTGATPCARWAFTLSAYNGGLSWIDRDKSLARARGAQAELWFGNVENYTSRSKSARDENRGYVKSILTRLEPAYINAGWPGQAVCA